jgi:hypothetical protein
MGEPMTSITLNGGTQTLHWKVPGAKPKLITLGGIPASSGGGPCEGNCEQLVISRPKGTNLGYWSPSSISEDSFEWYWKVWSSLIVGRIQDQKSGCKGQPTVPSGMTVISGEQSIWCQAGLVQEVGYLGEQQMLTNVPIEDAGEKSYDFQTYGASKEPSMEALATALSESLKLPKYHYLSVWYRFQFAEGCDPDSCKVPDCRGMALETCENLLETAGFDDLSHGTVASGATDFYVQPEGVIKTEPASGTEAAINEPIAIALNPSESEWESELVSRYRPELVFPVEEAFRPDSYKEFTDGHLNWLTRENGEPLEGLFLSSIVGDVLGPIYPDEVVATDLDRLHSGGTGNETENSVEQASSVTIYLREEDFSLYANKTYARAVSVPLADRTWLQYWFFYYHNPSPPGALGFGEHQGDWEIVQFQVKGLPESGLEGEPSLLGPGPEPESAAAAEHSDGALCAWGDVEKTEAGVPVFYPAVDSHATYFGPYEDEFYGDEVTGEGEPLRPSAVPISESEGWVQWQGVWGDTEPGEIPKIESGSPHGPATPEHEQWSAPTAWAEGLEEGGGCE